MRLQVTRKSDLALQALLALDRGPERRKGADLAAELAAAPAFMAQVMVPLVQSGWVASGTGPTGGYRLLADLDAISVLDVIEAVEGPTDTGRCMVDGGPCGGDLVCALHEAWSRARSVLAGHLAGTPVSAAADSGRRVAPAGTDGADLADGADAIATATDGAQTRGAIDD